MSSLFLIIQFAFAMAANPLQLIDEGDRHWSKGEWRKATHSWKSALSSNDQFVLAMARYRLMFVASNITLPYHGLKGDQEMMSCEVTDKRCVLARIDREYLFSRFGLPSDLELARTLLAYLPEEFESSRESRSVALKTAPLSDLTADGTDGFGLSLLNHSGKWPRGPGGPQFSLGFFAVQNLGYGATFSWLQPNVDERMGILSTYVSAATSGFGVFRSLYQSEGRFFFRLDTELRHAPYYRRVDEQWESQMVEVGAVTPAMGWTHSLGRVWLGPSIRWDQFSNPIAGHGLAGHVTFGNSNLYFKQDIETSFVDYLHLKSVSQAAAIHSSGLALYIAADIAPTVDTPWWRLPTAGGGRYIRLPPAQWIRHPYIYAAVAEWRFLQKSMVGGVVFGEAAYTDELAHWGGGIGLRLRTPPNQTSSLRLDVGYGQSGWGVLAGVGEFF